MMLQKQKDTMEQVRRTGQMPPPPQNLIGADEIKNLGNKLTKHSDSLEKHGLVDYAQGVREEEIVASEYIYSTSRFRSTRLIRI